MKNDALKAAYFFNWYVHLPIEVKNGASFTLITGRDRQVSNIMNLTIS